ncbi:L,D-transpeptidase [Amycolatopsis viridis]|uniref:Lipoprotein-anchoring transpeptidase ErfK/SrfK n=1 Tax=Amycolatopsis viridis TaxID=185678 RepID=A0ABX0SN80_9PSEU|nr:Ig-like domain-containing protein [Amycolatopsis viridis]NIH77998.1 lipoprotein-anchoring transpeptidase ErfK/SrfK [Amycolatopsis viridis]
MTKLHKRRGPLALVALGLAAMLTLSACSGDAGPDGAPGQPGSTDAQQTAATSAKLTVQPADGARDVAPADAAQVSIADGELQAVTLTNPDGKQVAGRLAEDKHSWTVAEPLGYGKTYTWSGTAVGADGKQSTINGSFTTVNPRRQVAASLNVGDNQTYGIAMPITVSFGTKVTDKAAVEHALTVETTPKTEGSWAWVSDTSAHWRPKDYWQPNTQVKVTANLYGRKIGEGIYGKQDVAASFSIGRSQIVKGDTRTHRMQVIRDGVQIADYPVSYGLDSDPGRVTHSGVHVVMSKHATYSMNNPRYNYFDVNVPWAVRISNNGEFIHGLAESMWAQGKQNISHGCLNLSPARAREYYDGALVGDPVEITGSTQTLSAKDGDYSDWTYSWAEWTKLSALAS